MADADAEALAARPREIATIQALIHTFQSITVAAKALALGSFECLAHETRNLLDRARSGDIVLEDSSIALLRDSIDLAHGLSDNLAVFLEADCETGVPRLVPLPVGHQVDTIQRFLASGASGAGTTQPMEASAALKTQARNGVEATAHKSVSVIRVETERLDTLMNLVGEIVIAQSQALKIATELESEAGERLQTALYDVERLSRSLQDQVMGVRMIPIGPTFKQLVRFVHDTSHELGKQVDLVITGEDTELDKTVIEQIDDPLRHLIRNALDHGLETADERAVAGKPERGTLELRAGHQGGNVIIEVIDDGRGIPRDKLLATAVAKGLVTDGQDFSDGDVLRLSFHPGLSTATSATDLSSRGVGMAIVKRNVEALRGRVDVESVEGHGSTLRITLPLTLAIIEGMVVSVSGQAYIVPVLSIVESIRPDNRDIRHVSGQGEVLYFRGEYLPLYRLYEWLDHEPVVSDPAQGIVMVVEDTAGRRALLADDLLGQQQVVIKNLEDNFTRLDGICGATILAEGNVALILDIVGLYHQRRSTAELGRDHDSQEVANEHSLTASH